MKHMFISPDPSIHRQAINELVSDLNELQQITNSNLNIIGERIKRLEKLKSKLRKESSENFLEYILILKEKYVNILETLECADTKNYQKLITIKKVLFEKLRILQSQLAAVITMLDYQSPSFGYAMYPEAGLQTDMIYGTINDYKRDGHIDEVGYEKAFIKEYIDIPLKPYIHSFMTSSGMSAFATILNFLQMEGKLDGYVVVGRSSYFQYKGLLTQLLRDQIIAVDETDTDGLINAIRIHKPSAVFIDSLSNASSIPVPDILKLVKLLDSSCVKDTYLVIDNTCLSLFCQPLAFAQNLITRLHIIIFESLMKYHHFGFDRATGGIIIAKGNDAAKIFECRKNLGTNIPDTSVYSFPIPNKNILKKRLLRFQRNALELSSYLRQFIKNLKTPVENIIYPAFSDHPSYKWAKNLRFLGSFFNLKFRKQYRSVSFYKKFINNVILNGKKEGVEIIAGTSFGLNNTRISLTSLWTDYGEPFIRIAAGNEDIESVNKLKTVLSNAIITANSHIPAKLLISLIKAKKKIGIDKLC